jgi:tRNA modification GTPase
LNKSDLGAVENGEGFSGKGKRGDVILSAKTGEGVERLLAAIHRELLPEEGGIIDEAPMTRLRHVDAARKAIAALKRARTAAGEGLSLEFPAYDIREAATALSGITGEIAPQDVLDSIFDSFCVGK